MIVCFSDLLYQLLQGYSLKLVEVCDADDEASQRLQLKPSIRHLYHNKVLLSHVVVQSNDAWLSKVAQH